jgi:hypothetical protein
VFSERRIGRWITGNVAAGRDLDDLLAAWDQARFKGAIWSYHTGPANSRLFQTLVESLESDYFFLAADTEFDELINQGKPRHLSEHVSDRLKDLQSAKDTGTESVMKYLTAVTAWFRYALITRHSLNYLAWHVNEVLVRLSRARKSVDVPGMPTSKGLLTTFLLSQPSCQVLPHVLNSHFVFGNS